jgi:hypothetical protein
MTLISFVRRLSRLCRQGREKGQILSAGRAHRQWFRALIADNMASDLAGGQGHAETRPERRARSQDRRRDA